MFEDKNALFRKNKQVNFGGFIGFTWYRDVDITENLRLRNTKSDKLTVEKTLPALSKGFVLMAIAEHVPKVGES